MYHMSITKPPNAFPNLNPNITQELLVYYINIFLYTWVPRTVGRWSFRIIYWWLGIIKFCIDAWVLSNVIYLLALEIQKTRNPTDHRIPMTETYDKLNTHAEKSLLSGVDEVNGHLQGFRWRLKAVFYLFCACPFWEAIFHSFV